MHVSSRTAWLAQGICNFEHRAVVVAQRLLVFGGPFGDHKPVVVDGLDLQVVVKLCNALELFKRFSVHDRAEQFACLTGRAKYQPIPVLDELGARHERPPVVVVQKAVGDQLIQVFEARLGLDQNDEMIARQVFKAALLGAQAGQYWIDVRDPLCVLLVFQLFKQFNPNACQDRSIFARTVVFKGANLQFLRQDIELEAVEMRQHNTRHFQRINISKLPLDLQSLAGRLEERQIKSRVVRDQYTVAQEGKELVQCLRQVGRIGYGLI